MRKSCETDADILRRAVNDQSSTLPEMIADRFNRDVRKSFDESYRLMSAEGKPGTFLLKVGSVGLGCVMMADGIHHIISGADEEVDDLFIHAKSGSNYVRIFSGIAELGLGAMLAYLGAVKGPLKPVGR